MKYKKAIKREYSSLKNSKQDTSFSINDMYKIMFDNRQKPKDEEWRDVVGYEGLYKVSNYGVVIKSNYKIVGTYYSDEFYEEDKYNVACLTKNGKGETFAIHRLVALAFVDNPNPKEFNVVNHKDENRHNNYYKNLEWCTTVYNLHYGSADKKRLESIAIKKDLL